MNKLYNLSNPQKSIWLTEQYYYGTNINNICGTAIISNKLNFNILQKAINTVILTNDNFKLRFKKENNILKQYQENISHINIEIVSLKNKNEVSNLENKVLSRVFKITEEPLFEFKIFKFKDNSGGFLLNIHHLLADSWTLGLTCRKIMNIYSILINNPLEQISISPSYIKYLENEQLYLNSSRYEKDKLYWEKIFETIPNIITLPSINNSNTHFSYQGKRDLFIISKREMSRINKFCKNNKISIFNFFMAIFSIYLHKLTNIDDFVIGTPILNRSTFEEKNTTGMFVNVAPLRIKVGKHSKFLSFIQEIAKNSMGLLRHQKYPYQDILNYIREKDNSIPNLYNTVLSYQITRANNESNFKYDTRWAFNGNSANDLDIQLYDLDEDGTLNIAYDYKLDKYTQKEITNLHNRLMNIISQVISYENIDISQIKIITKQEEKELLKFNKTDIRYNKNIPIIKFFEKQVKATPDDIALTFKGTHFTYKELNEKANSLAHILRENGVTNNTIVGLMVNRSPQIIVGILAILKAGGAYLPIDPEYPEDRISYMIQDSKAEILLTNKFIDKKVKCSKIIDIDLNNILYDNNKENLKNISKPSDLSYIIYTSGSTGKPKGVMLTQQNYSNFYTAMLNRIKYLKNGVKYSIVSITTVSFDIFGFETLISLTRGLHVYLTDYFEQKYTDYLANLIENEKIDIIQTTPSVMRFHLDNAKNINQFSKLKFIMLAGEQLPEDLVNRLKEIAPGVIVLDGYGPSETTIFSSVNNVTNLNKISIGKPIANTQFYILDKDMNLLPKYTTGEIFIGGDGVGKGYLFKDNLTKERFLPNIFDNGIMYKSGDLGFWQDDGSVICQGRIDHQVKLRGLRVELGEIENKINKFIYNSKTKSVVVVKGENTNAYLHAFICSDTTINLEELKNYLFKNLPNYMVPSTYSILDDFPTTPNGKIDRNALVSIKVETLTKNIVEPSTETENLIYREICNIIQNSNFGVTDDFFSIGLDSLKIINLSLNLSEKIKAKLSISDFYALTNIRKLAEFIDNYKSNSILEIHHTKKRNFYPISSAQERIYYAQKLDENSTSYNICGGILIHKHISQNAIKNIFEILVERHAAFRTSFIFEQNNIVQKIHNNINLNIEFIKNKNINVQKTINNFAKPFNLENAPLLRIKVHYLKNKETLILLDTHHIVVDGTSLSILINEFMKLLNSEKLENNNFKYVDFAVWENEFKQTEKFKELENYWENKFKGQEIPVINLPYNYPISSKRAFVGNTISKQINQKVFSDLENLSIKYNTSSYILFISAFYILLNKYTGQDDIIIGSPTASRDLKETQNLIGMFVNNMILKNHIDASYTFKEFINQTKDIFLDVMAHQPYPYETISRKFNNNFFDVMFTYQNKFDFVNKDIDVIFANTKTSKFNLSLEIIPQNCLINLEYNTSLFNDETANKILNHYINILSELIINPDRKIADIPMLDELEQNKIIYGFNNTKLEYPENKTLAQLIEEQALNTPDKIAITFEDKSLTFKELNDKSNMLAHFLRLKGLNRNEIVGIMTERSLELIVAILGVLKSGACYIPIDPTFPKSRINYMLTNSNAKLLLITSNTKDKLDFENKICIDLDKLSYLSNDTSPLENINMPNDNSYIIYTSGSTGTPKGVVLKQKSLVNLTHYLNNYVEFLKSPKESDCMASVTTASFDIFIFETLICLQKGIKVAISNNDEQVIPSKLNDLIKRNNVTAIQMTPSRMQLLVDNINDLPDFIKIKYVILAGEPLPNSLVKQLKVLGIKKIYNGYGPSETTVFSTFTDVTDYEDITIGKPLANTFTYILDNNLHPVPVGVAGELYIGGDGVGNGYLNKPNLTNASFIPNPFIENTLMYKTGDLCKFLPNGELYYIGRVDNQIKIRGLRIELDEIENKILSFPFIQKAKVIKQTIHEREFLSAYFIATDRINIANLRSYLLEFLPNYMVPTYFTALDKFPYTPNGKIDKKALPLPKTDLKEIAKKYTPPETDLEIKLVKIFEDILNTKPIGIHDDFFELGGDSILAMRLNIELLNICNHIKYSDIFTNPTISKLILLMNNSNKNITNVDLNLPSLDSFSSILNNNLQIPKKIDIFNPKNILLTGSTGFLGIHILSSLLDETNTTVYCLIREEPVISPMDKLKNKLKYYFKDKYNNLLETRIKIINGDIEDVDLDKYAHCIDLVINSAAKVSHFGNYNDFFSINVLGTKHLLDFCKKYNKKFYQISTLSVSGNSFVDNYASFQNFESDIDYDETKFYIGQNLDNVYVRSKFEAEQLVLHEIENGLEGYILRVGNLMPRFSDGVFQENVSENAYINRLTAFLKLKILPKNIKDVYLEFTPIDFCSKAITKIITHPSKNNCIYHLFNHNHIYINKLLKILKNYDYNIDIIETEKFKDTIRNILKDNENKNILNHLINDFNQNLDLDYESKIKLKSNFTTEFLSKLDFNWPSIDNKYIGYIISIIER